MNVVKLYGGLGNQLFQYAFGRAQMENGLDVGFNKNWFSRNGNGQTRPYVLDKFNTKLIKESPFLSQKNLFEKKIKYNPNLTSITSFNFYGYWQDPRYFAHMLPILKEEIRVREEFYTPEFLKLREIILNANSISIHIRRGDFIGKVNLLSLDYYLNALEEVNGRVFVFSDDTEWVKRNWFKENFPCVHLNEYLDFELMRLCKHNIIANSTFSWWAAMLNNNTGKIVVAPKQWRLAEEQQKEMSLEFLHPKGWVIL